MTLTRREKVMIVAGLIIVTLVLYLVYFLMPYLSNISDAKTKLGAAQSQLSMLNAKETSKAKLDSDITALNAQLKTQWSSVPVGIDHARILLYLKELTDGRTETVIIASPDTAQVKDMFLLQTITLDFKTSYPAFLNILDDLKKNTLYNRLVLVKADYVPNVIEFATQAPGGTGQPVATQTPTPTPTAPADINVITVHMEFAFYALQPYGSELPAPAMTPTATDRSTGLMPGN